MANFARNLAFAKMADFGLKMASGSAGPAQRPKRPILPEKWPPGVPSRPRGQNGRFCLKNGLRLASGGAGEVQRPTWPILP